MKKYFTILIIAIVICQGCGSTGLHPFVSGTWVNDHISSDISLEINSLNKQILNSFSDSDYKVIYDLMSDTLKARASIDAEKKFFAQLQPIVHGRQFKPFDQFYIENSTPVATDNIQFGEGDNAYTFSFTSMNKEVFVSMNLVGDSNTETMVTFVYGKFNGQWKLNILQADRYAMFGKTAFDFYRDAQRLYNDGCLVDAVNTMDLCRACEHPVANFFQYKNVKEMDEYNEKIKDSMQKKFPMPYTLEYVNTQPKVFNIYYEQMEEGLICIFNYLSGISISDNKALKKENDEIQMKINNVFHGFNKNNSIIVYKAYNRMPEYGKPSSGNYQSPGYYQFVYREK